MLQKTIQAKIISPTERKRKLLQKEYDGFQLYLNGVDWLDNLYSATKQQADKVLKNKNPKNEQPMILRNDCIKLVSKETKLTRWWIKIPIYNVRGGIYVPIVFSKKQENLIYEGKVCDSELVKRGKDFFVHIVIKREIQIRKVYNDVLAIDMGIRRIASVVQFSTRKPVFIGKELRHLRGHHFYLRKKVQSKKIKHLNRWLRKSKEKRQTNYWLHKYAKQIVEQTKDTNSFIVLGNLKHIRKTGKKKGRKFKRKLNSFPFYKLSAYIKYKAEAEGIEVIEVSETYTSQTCHRCGEKGIRRCGLFKCKCGLQDNADRNGAINIAVRGIGQALSQGLSLTKPESLAYTLESTRQEPPQPSGLE